MTQTQRPGHVPGMVRQPTLFRTFRFYNKKIKRIKNIDTTSRVGTTSHFAFTMHTIKRSANNDRAIVYSVFSQTVCFFMEINTIIER